MRDHVDLILGQWRRELPELNTAPVEVIGRISRLTQLLHEHVEPVFAEYGLSGGEYDVLAALRRCGPPFRLTPSALSQALIVTSGGMTKRLKALDAVGLVRRVPSPTDRRSMPVQLTPRGRKLVESVALAHVANEEQLLAPLDDRQRRDLADLLRRFLIAMGDAAPGRPERTTTMNPSQARGGRQS